MCCFSVTQSCLTQSCHEDHACRIELEFDLKASYLNLAHLNVLQCPEVITSKRPAGKLVSYEFMYLVFFHYLREDSLIRASSSQVRMRSL